MKRPVASLLTAYGLALVGTRLSMIAIPWLVLMRFGDPMLAGITGFAEMMPYVIAKAACGPLLDRIGAMRISIWGDIGAIPVLVAIPLLDGAGLLTPVVIAGLVVILGALRGPADAAKYALVPEVAAAAGVDLTKVTGAAATLDRLAVILGAGLGAGLITATGPTVALLANAGLLTLAVIVCGLGLRGIAAPASASAAPYLAQLRDGVRFLWQDPVLRVLVVMVAVTNLLDQGMAQVMIPVWASNGSGINALALVQIAFAVGAVTGSVLASGWASALPRLPVYALAYLIVGLPRYALFAVEAPLQITVGALAVAGFAAGFINPIIGALMFERIPKELNGRVSALFTAIAWALMPFGSLLAGALIGIASLNVAFWTMGLVYFGATMMPLLIPALQGITALPPSEDGQRQRDK